MEATKPFSFTDENQPRLKPQVSEEAEQILCLLAVRGSPGQEGSAGAGGGGWGCQGRGGFELLQRFCRGALCTQPSGPGLR